MKFIGKIVDGFMLMCNVVVLILFVLSAYSDRIPPSKHLYASYMGILFPLFLLLTLFFVLYWVVRRRYYFLLTVGMILFCWEPTTRYLPYHLFGNEVDTTDLKILTYNTCALGRSALNKDALPNKVLDFIKNEDADIVCLQEYTFNNSGLSEKIIRKELAAYPHYHFSRASNHTTNSGLAIFSKFPITKTKQIDFKSMYNTSCLYELDIDGQKVTVINNHLESNKLSIEDRAFYLDLIKHFEPEKLVGARTTLIHKLGAAYKIREIQTNQLRTVIDKVTTPIIVCGDLNDTPISYCYHNLRGEMVDAYQNAGFGPSISYHESGFFFRIDHLFHSSDIKSTRAKVHFVKFSDHYPITVSIKLPK